MVSQKYRYEHFFSRDGFNKSLGHFQAVSSLLGDINNKVNLAEVLNELLTEKEIEQNQLAPILYALLVDKFSYRFVSHNMQQTISDFSVIHNELKRWNAVDLVISYHHPELGLCVINPKNQDHWLFIQSLKKNEFLTIYCGGFEKEIEEKTASAAINRLLGLFYDKKGKTPEVLLKGSFTYSKPKPPAPKKPVPKKAAGRKPKQEKAVEKKVKEKLETVQPAPAQGKAVRMTPLYAIQVTNELFHNGNVEAWKKAIQSYKVKYPALEVYIFYDGEKINDINTLFKWGKVKHGSSILFSVAGEEIKDVAKLKRYLYQGASPRFEDFLRFPVNTVLKLF